MSNKLYKREMIFLGRYSNSQNGGVYAIEGISPCLCSGGYGHDAFVPKILIINEDDIEYEEE